MTKSNTKIRTVADIMGERIREARIAKGLTQASVADAARTAPAVVSIAEGGGGGLSIESLCKYARALGVEPASLLPSLDELGDVLFVRDVRPAKRSKPSPIPTGQAYVDAVLAGARRYIEEHGRPPTVNNASSGPATAYVGFPTTWQAIDSAFHSGANGAPECGGLRRFLIDEGVLLFGEALEDAIAEGARLYLAEHGCRPRARSGDARRYIGLRGNWSHWNDVLREGGHGTTVFMTLHAFLNARGIG